MSGISVQVNMDQLRAVQLNLAHIDGAGRTVTCRAVNKTLAGVRTDAVAEIHSRLNLTKTRIRQDFKLYKATFSGWPGKVKAEGEPVGLASFGARQTQKGVSVQVLRNSSRQLLKHAFIATQQRTDKSTYKNVYWRSWAGERTGPAGGKFYPREYRQPIERLTGPRIEDIFGKREVMAAVEKKADARLSKNLDHELEYFLSNL